MRNYQLINGIFAAPDPGGFDYTDGDAAEEYLLDRIRNAADLSTGSAELAAAIRDWPSLYHLSPARAHLLRPLTGLLKGKKVLEAGCGCGSLTRFLGELGAEVVALEGSGRRALITRERCRDQQNVRVVRDNFEDFQWEGSFDIVLLVGVLEYSQQFIKDAIPPLRMLRKAKEFLSPGGHLILAIENKLGLKYWAGAPEDHTGRPFDGIEDRYSANTAVTFGKKELEDLLSDAGFSRREFLYPFPDYKLPVVIVKEEAFFTSSLDLQSILSEQFDYPHGSGQATEFSLTQASAAVLENQLMPALANSFLIIGETGNIAAGTGSIVAETERIAAGTGNIDSNLGNKVPSGKTLVYTYNSTRKKCYCKSNLIVCEDTGPIRVLRERLYPEAPYPEDQPVIQHILNEDYFQGRLLSMDASEIVTRQGWTLAGLAAWANTYYQVLLDHAVEEGRLPGRYVDLTPFNILTDKEGRKKVFDQEWECPENVPLSFVFFRGLVYCLDKIGQCACPAENTPIEVIPLVSALIRMFLPFDASDLGEIIRLEEKYFGAIALSPGQPFAHGMIRLKKQDRQLYDRTGQGNTMSEQVTTLSEQVNTLSGQVNTLSDQLNTTSEALHATRLELEQTAHEYTLFRNRSELEVARIRQDHLKHSALLQQQSDWYRRTYEERSLGGVLLQRRLSAARSHGKYLTAFLLSSIQEKGLKSTISLILKTMFSKGLHGLLAPRKTLLPLMGARIPGTPLTGSVQRPLYEVPDRVTALAEIQTFIIRPKISFIMPVYNTDHRWLEKAVDSIRAQWYDNWELNIADDGSTRSDTRRLLQSLGNDSKIKITRLPANVGISEASNAAIRMADGDYLALMDHDDEITPDALYQLVKDLHWRGDADIFYTDECKVDEQGDLSDPFYKPDYSDELLFNMMYPGHLTIYKKSFLLEKVGLFRAAYDLSQDYDLMLRAVEKTDRIRHIEKLVYHWRMISGSSARGDKPHARRSNLAALEDAIKRRGIAADVVELPTANRVLVHRDRDPMVSVIIPTDNRKNLEETLNSLYTHTAYPNFEIVVVTNSRLIAEMETAAGAGARPKYVPYNKPYNFSDKSNAGAASAAGEIVIFFNDDVRPLHNDWIENLIEYLFIPGVGGVSPKLVYEDDSIQYAGMAAGVRNLTGTTFHGYAKDSTDYINFPQLVRNVSILSGACLAMKKQVFEELGGFDAVNTPSSHSDVDLSFKILDSRRRCVYTPYATLRHIGHLSLREYDNTSAAARAKDKADIYLLRRWIRRISADPYFTVAMRNHLYHDSPEPYRIYAPHDPSEPYRIYAPHNSPAPAPIPGSLPVPETSLMPESLSAPITAPTSKPQPAPASLPDPVRGDILLVSHDLSLTGAPLMLLQLCRLLIRNGYFVTVVCEKEGPAGELFLESGAPVIIDSLLLQQHHTLSRFAQNFDHVVCNTAVTWPVIQQLNKLTHTIWWIHEAKVLESFVVNPGFVATLTTTATVVSVSEYALQYIRRYNAAAKKIYYGYEDIRIEDLSGSRPGLPITSNASPAPGRRKLSFSIIGSIEPRKGQDILIRALQSLDQETRENIEIKLVGRPHDMDFYQELLRSIGATGQDSHDLTITGETDHQDCLEIMRRSDVIICPSRDDPFPVVIVEALCLGKPCIVSSNTGFSELIEDGVNGYIIPNEDSEALAFKIRHIVDYPSSLIPMARAARQLYEQYLNLSDFEEKFLALLRPATHPATEISTETAIEIATGTATEAATGAVTAAATGAATEPATGAATGTATHPATGAATETADRRQSSGPASGRKEHKNTLLCED